MSSVHGRSVNSLSLLCLKVWRLVGVNDLQTSLFLVDASHSTSTHRAGSSPRMSSIRNEFLATGTGGSWGRDVEPDVIKVSSMQCIVDGTTVDEWCDITDSQYKSGDEWCVRPSVDLVVTTYCCYWWRCSIEVTGLCLSAQINRYILLQSHNT